MTDDDLIEAVSTVATLTDDLGFSLFADELRKRKANPCTFDPQQLAGAPIGQMHCPKCGEIVIAGMPHESLTAALDWQKGQEK